MHRMQARIERQRLAQTARVGIEAKRSRERKGLGIGDLLSRVEASER